MALTQVDQGLLSSTAQYTGFKNRLINGAMVIDQRNAGAASANTISGYFLDRWIVGQSTTGKLIAQQNAGAVTPPVGFGNYLGITSQSSFPVGASGLYYIQQAIEGFNTSDLGFGTANAKTITISFQVYSSLTGTFGGSIYNNAGDRFYPFSYSISSANTWTSISITIAGDTTGTWVGATNGAGMWVFFSLGAGTSFGGTAGAWVAGSFGAGPYAPSGGTSVVGTNGATFYITGVQLEKGSTATSFDYRPYGTELGLCQRYYYKISGSTQYARFGHGFCGAGSTTNFYATVIFPVSMRAIPSSVDTTGSLGVWNGGGINAVSAVTLDTSGLTPQVAVAFVTSSGLTAQNPYQLIGNNSGSASLAFSSEL
jgi:hypothetical protein